MARCMPTLSHNVHFSGYGDGYRAQTSILVIVLELSTHKTSTYSRLDDRYQKWNPPSEPQAFGSNIECFLICRSL